MPEQQYDVRSAAGTLASLSSHGRTPDPETEARARRVLATARLDRELRATATSGVVLDDVQVGHLVGLLLSQSKVAPEVQAFLESAVRQAVRDGQAAHDSVAG